MFDGMIESLRAWLESIRAWVLGQEGLAWMHGWVADTHVSMIWIFVVSLVLVVVLAIGFWPPLKPLDESETAPPEKP